MTAALIIFYLIIAGAGYWLKYLNLTYLKAHGKTVPSEFEGTVDSSLLQKITAYTFENSRAGIVESIIGNVLLLFFLFGGLLGAYDRWHERRLYPNAARERTRGRPRDNIRG